MDYAITVLECRFDELQEERAEAMANGNEALCRGLDGLLEELAKAIRFLSKRNK